MPPLRRDDVTREADLIEEVSRIDGLEKLPATLPKRRDAYGLLTPEQRLRRRALDALVGRGLYEAVGWTFAAPSVAERLRLPAEDERSRAVVIENPLSEEQSRLRTMLLGSLLEWQGTTSRTERRIWACSSTAPYSGRRRVPRRRVRCRGGRCRGGRSPNTARWRCCSRAFRADWLEHIGAAHG